MSQEKLTTYRVKHLEESAFGENAAVDNTGSGSTIPNRVSTSAGGGSYYVEQAIRSAVGENATVINAVRRGSLTAHFSEQPERVLIAQIERLLDTRQTKLLDQMLSMIQAENETLSDTLQAMLTRITARLRVLQRSPLLQQRDPLLAQQVGATLDVIDQPQLSGRHRLKIALPIVPKLVWFESEVEVAQNGQLLQLWDEFLAYLSRSQTTS